MFVNYIFRAVEMAANYGSKKVEEPTVDESKNNPAPDRFATRESDASRHRRRERGATGTGSMCQSVEEVFSQMPFYVVRADGKVPVAFPKKDPTFFYLLEDTFAIGGTKVLRHPNRIPLDAELLKGLNWEETYGFTLGVWEVSALVEFAETIKDELRELVLDSRLRP